MNVRLGTLLVALPAILAAQAAVETAIGAGRAATTAAPARKVGDSIAGAFDRLNRTLQNRDGAQPAEPAGTPAARPKKAAAAKPQPASAPAEPKNAEVAFEDPSSIQEGMEYAEVVRRFGPPSLKLTTGPGEETLSYKKKDLTVEATVRDGKVAAIQKTGAATKSTALVIQ